MKQLRLYLIILCLPLLAACVDEDSYDDTAQGNFEALWKIMDEHYCFFDEKNIDWNEVHSRYARQVNEGMSEGQLFEVLTNMLAELRDGHVNLYTNFDTGRYWSWKEDYPSNVSDTLIDKYLGTDYKMASGMKYRRLDDNIGYVRYESFAYAPGSSALDDMLSYLMPCRGLIIDLRDNGGGVLDGAEKLAARFTNEEVVVGYIKHKTGKGHNDFSDLREEKLKPSSGLRWQKPVVVLTNRGVFSAANAFVQYMKCFPRVKVVGDRTGGGAGLPFSSELPNSWSVRFSASPMYDRDRQSTEFGIDPDYRVDLAQQDFLEGRDTIIEFARKLLTSNS